ncbi:MAG: peptidase LD-carboxypeptidase [Acidobacteriaceae bacterium]|nr:peptidase LD-carboxypeptidase [Acidobacteriaceae bacterium]
MTRQPGQPARNIPAIPKPNANQTLGIIAPASHVSREELEAGCATLQKMGYKTFYLDSILDRDLYFAGSEERRTEELEEMFKRPEITGIMCARGGYGSNHLLPHINLDAVRANPKFFMGYSDITTLLTYFCDHADLVTFHGPMVKKDYERLTPEMFSTDVLSAGAMAHDFLSAQGSQPVPGIGQGILYGGCLSMLAASLGTPYEIQTEGTILFIEDIATKPYQIHRMLMQLKLAGKFKDVRGIVFGEMMDCVQPGEQNYTLQEVIKRELVELNIPVGFGLHSGHVSQSPNLCLPIGVAAELNVSENEVKVKII